MDEVFFILTANPSPTHGMWCLSVLTILEISAVSTKGTLTPYIDLGVDYERRIPACTFHYQGIGLLYRLRTYVTL